MRTLLTSIFGQFGLGATQIKGKDWLSAVEVRKWSKFHWQLRNQLHKFKLVRPEDIQEVLNNQAIVDRWENAIQIKGTQSYHDYRVDTNDNRFLFVRHYTSSEEYKRVKIRK